jgi:hypothetical protein
LLNRVALVAVAGDGYREHVPCPSSAVTDWPGETTAGDRVGVEMAVLRNRERAGSSGTSVTSRVVVRCARGAAGKEDVMPFPDSVPGWTLPPSGASPWRFLTLRSDVPDGGGRELFHGGD